MMRSEKTRMQKLKQVLLIRRSPYRRVKFHLSSETQSIYKIYPRLQMEGFTVTFHAQHTPFDMNDG